MTNVRNSQTAKEKLTSMFIAKGMFLEEAKEVTELAIKHVESLDVNYQMRWESPASHYDENLYRVIFGISKHIAYEWIEQNKPNAWYKLMFA